MALAIFFTCSISSGKASVAGTTGTLAISAMCLAAILLPRFRITLPLGPINAIPAFSQASAKSGFSDKKPYPGWIASTLASLAIRIISSMSK